MNLHQGHKILLINDEESLKKENITVENYTNDFNENSKKVEDLKKKIEKEILEIDKLYDKVYKEATKSYELKHEKLTKEENDLKEKLQTEVTKVKEKLENSLSFTNEIIKNMEKIIKGIKKLENEENNMIKVLSYISKINKTKKEMNKLFDEQMINLKINFIEEESNIKYEEYIFNGISPPKDIEIKDITNNSFKILWNYDYKNLNIDKNKIKFKIEMRKKKENEKFEKIYEGKDINYSVNNLKNNTDYEIKICCIYNNLDGIWSEIKSIKIPEFDSLILSESERCQEFSKKVIEWTGYKNFELLYRGTRDGMISNSFHNKCNNINPTLCLFKCTKGYIFGGYSPTSWTSLGNYKSNSNCFIFSLTNIHGTKPTKFQNSNSRFSIYVDSNYGPCFGGGFDIGVFDGGRNNEYNYSSFPHSYKDILGKGKSIFSGDLNTKKFTLKEIEVFKLSN